LEGSLRLGIYWIRSWEGRPELFPPFLFPKKELGLKRGLRLIIEGFSLKELLYWN